jgi:hypothetical protein
MQRRAFLASALALPAMRPSRAALKLDLAAIDLLHGVGEKGVCPLLLRLLV